MDIAALLKAPVRKLSLRGQMKLPSGKEILLTGRDILSLRITEGVSDGMLLGSCPSAQMKLTLSDPENRFLLHGDKRGAVFISGAETRMFLTVWDEEEHMWKERPLGVFYVTDMTGVENSAACVLQLTDALGCKLDGAYAESGLYPCSVGDMALSIARQAGMALYVDFPGADILITSPPDFSGFSLRGALGALCACCGSFAHMDREGKLCITPVKDQNGAAPYLLEAKNTLIRKYGETAFGPVRAVKVNTFYAPRDAQDGVRLYTEEVGILPDEVVSVERNPLFGYGQAHTDALGQRLLHALQGLYMEKASLVWQGDPDLLLGRCVEMRDKRNAVTFTSVTRQVLIFDKGFSMQTECTLRPRAASGAGMVITASGGIRGASLTGSIHGNVLIDGTLGVTALKAGSITSKYIAAEAVDTAHLTAGAVTAEKIKSGEITAVHIAGKTITAEQLAANLITANSGLIANSAIGTAQIADGSITSAKIISLNADVIDAGTLKADRLLLVGDGGVIYEINAQSSGLSMTELQKEQYQKYLNGTVIVAKSITAAQIAAKTITANEILAGTITAAEIAANAITADKIAAHAITVDKLASNVGSSLDISSNVSITNLVRDVNAMPTTHVQYTAPSNVKKGDVWVNTGASTWADLQGMTWQTAAAQPWGAHYNALPVTRVWDGQKWQTVADQSVITDQYTLINQTKEQLGLMATKEELNGKVSRTEYQQDADAIKMRVQTVEENSGKAETVTNTAMMLDNTGIHLKTGGSFTVDSGNFDLDENGNASMQNASINGELLNGGHPVLTARNLVVSTTQPTSPIVGMVWVKPVGAVVASFVYNNTSVITFEKMEDAHTMTNLGSATTASGTFTYKVSIPYKVTSPVTAARYLKMTVNGTVLFDVPLASNAGTYTLEQSGTLTEWLGNAETLSFTLELHFLSGQDETYLHNVHRLNTGAVELKLTAKTEAASGWLSTEVQVYNG